MKLSIYKIGEKSTLRNSTIAPLRLFNFFRQAHLKSFETSRTGIAELSNKDEANNTNSGIDV